MRGHRLCVADDRITRRRHHNLGLHIFLSVPCHNALSRGKDETVIRRLVITNWPRTFLWTGKALWLSACP